MASLTAVMTTITKMGTAAKAGEETPKMEKACKVSKGWTKNDAYVLQE